MVPELSGGCPTGMDGVRWGEEVESTCLEMLGEGGQAGEMEEEKAGALVVKKILVFRGKVVVWPSTPGLDQSPRT